MWSNVNDHPVQQVSIIQMAMEEVEESKRMNGEGNGSRKQNFAEIAGEVMNNFAQKISKRIHKSVSEDSHEDVSSIEEKAKYLTDNHQLWNEFRQVLINSNVVTSVAVAEILNQFLEEKLKSHKKEADTVREKPTRRSSIAQIISKPGTVLKRESNASIQTQNQLRQLRRASTATCNAKEIQSPTSFLVGNDIVDGKNLSDDMSKCEMNVHHSTIPYKNFNNSTVFEKMQRRVSNSSDTKFQPRQEILHLLSVNESSPNIPKHENLVEDSGVERMKDHRPEKLRLCSTELLKSSSYQRCVMVDECSVVFQKIQRRLSSNF